jgi:hypothetical protein
MSSWTAERRALQSVLIRRWRPWERSTGPRTAAGKLVSSRNASRPGLIRQHLEAIEADLRMARSMVNRVAKGR